MRLTWLMTWLSCSPFGNYQFFSCITVRGRKKYKKIQSFSVYSKDKESRILGRENRILGEKWGKPTTKNKLV